MRRTQSRVFGNQVAVHNATTIDVLERLPEPLRVVAFPRIEPKHLLVKVAV
jgi:hypothetical protein